MGGRAIPRVAAASVPVGAAGEECGRRSSPAWTVVLPIDVCLSWLALAVTLAALAWWCQSWAIHSMTSRRVDRPGEGLCCLPIPMKPGKSRFRVGLAPWLWPGHSWVVHSMTNRRLMGEFCHLSSNTPVSAAEWQK